MQDVALERREAAEVDRRTVRPRPGETSPDLPREAVLLPSLKRGSSPWRELLQSLARLYEAGYKVDWRGFDAPYARRRVSLPSYPFRRERYWMERGKPGKAPAASAH